MPQRSPAATTPASILSDAIASLTHAANEALSQSEERAQSDLSRALSEARQAKNQRDEALNSLKTIESEQVTHKQQLDTWKVALDKADLTIQHQADTISQLRQENIHWKDQYARVEGSRQGWKERFTRAEQGRIRLRAQFEELKAQRDSGNTSGSCIDEHIHYSENATSPPSSSGSTKIGSASVDKQPLKRRQTETAIITANDKTYKAQAPRKAVGKSPIGGTKTQTKTATNTTRQAKDKAVPKQKSTQNPEGFAAKGPTQRVIRRVQAVVELPIKREDDEDEYLRTPIVDANGRTLPDNEHKPQKTAKKTAKTAEPPRAKSKSWQVYGEEDDTTPPAPAPVPKRRKSGIDQDYYEPGQGTYAWRSPEDANVRHRPPSRRKSIRDLRESDFEYREEEDEEEETDADELNIGRSLDHAHPEKPGKEHRTNETSSNAPTRKNARKRKAAEAMEVDEPVVSGRGAGKAVKTRY